MNSDPWQAYKDWKAYRRRQKLRRIPKALHFLFPERPTRNQRGGIFRALPLFRKK